MTSSGRQPSAIGRQAAMTSRPAQLPVVGREDGADGKTRITVRLQAPRWMRWLGGRGREIERTFALDRFGLEVYEACDGKTTVREMIRGFGRAHKISQAEAEMSVTTFLRTLMSKGLVAMGVAEGRTRNDG